MKIGCVNQSFWNGKNVFITGHTGFKGSWLSMWLHYMGANVTGYSLNPVATPNLYSVLDLQRLICKSHISDIRDFDSLLNAIKIAQPEILIHMAAQPLVRYSYNEPIETFDVNVMGTVKILEAARSLGSLKSTIIVTTDKCYENKEWIWGYREEDSLGGYDPYSSSKACSELVTAAYRQSFFENSNNSIASARAGNVIGGGDWSRDRLIPDALRAFERGEILKIRNPKSTRPWQHVLEPLSGYLILAQELFENRNVFASSWNFGPQDQGVRTVEEVLDLLQNKLSGSLIWEKDSLQQLHEATLLKLDCSKSQIHLGWTPKWSLEDAIEKIVEWHFAFQRNEDMYDITLNQIKEYMHLTFVESFE